MKLVILDRDGTINEDRDDYVKSPDEWVPIPGSLEAIARLNHAGWHTWSRPTSRASARGLFDMAALNAMHAEDEPRCWPRSAAASTPCSSARTAPDDGCRCRKPLPGLFEQIGERYGVELARVPMVGDSLRDLQAGVAVGCAPHLVRTGKGALLDEAELARARRAGAGHAACTPTSRRSPST